MTVRQLQAETIEDQRLVVLRLQLNAALLMVYLIHGGVKTGQTVNAGFPGRQIAKGIDKP
ncbi:hypothetical protein D3C81_1299050 [compost metagenome]